jgi:hypothetical protein
MQCSLKNHVKCVSRGDLCNPDSGRCVDPDGPVGRRLQGLDDVCSDVKQHECTLEGKICNPERHQCVVTHGSRGKRLLANAHYVRHHDVSHVAPHVWASVARSQSRRSQSHRSQSRRSQSRRSQNVNVPSSDVERATIDVLSKLGEYQRLDEQERHRLEENVRNGHRRGVMNRLFGSIRAALGGLWTFTKAHPAFAILLLAALLLGVHVRVAHVDFAGIINALDKLGTSFPGATSAKLFFQKYWPWAVKIVAENVPPTAMGIFDRIGTFLSKSKSLLWSTTSPGTWSFASTYATARWKAAVVAASSAYKFIMAFLARYLPLYEKAASWFSDSSSQVPPPPPRRSFFRLY